MSRLWLAAVAGLLLVAQPGRVAVPAAGLSADQAAAAAAACERFGRDNHYPPLSIAVLDLDARSSVSCAVTAPLR